MIDDLVSPYGEDAQNVQPGPADFQLEERLPPSWGFGAQKSRAEPRRSENRWLKKDVRVRHGPSITRRKVICYRGIQEPS